MKKYRFLLISTCILFVGVVMFSLLITERLVVYEQAKLEIAEKLSYENRMFSITEYFPFLSDEGDRIGTWQKLEQKASAVYNGALFYGLLLVCFVLTYAGLNVLFYKTKEHKYQIYGLILVFSALSFLYLGVQSPFIEIMAYEKNLAADLYLGEYEFEGRIYFLYQNKSILQLISVLYSGGNFLVAIILVLVSLVFPLIKLVVSIFVLLAPEKPINVKRYKMIRNLGKWSMAEIFAAAIFLAVFSYTNLDVAIDTGSETLIGTYFFVIFVALSINSGLYLKKAMKKAQGLSDMDLD